jgi:hypothetical protein
MILDNIVISNKKVSIFNYIKNINKIFLIQCSSILAIFLLITSNEVTDWTYVNIAKFQKIYFLSIFLFVLYSTFIFIIMTLAFLLP